MEIIKSDAAWTDSTGESVASFLLTPPFLLILSFRPRPRPLRSAPYCRIHQPRLHQAQQSCLLLPQSHEQCQWEQNLNPLQWFTVRFGTGRLLLWCLKAQNVFFSLSQWSPWTAAQDRGTISIARSLALAGWKLRPTPFWAEGGAHAKVGKGEFVRGSCLIHQFEHKYYYYIHIYHVRTQPFNRSLLKVILVYSFIIAKYATILTVSRFFFF